MGYILIVDRFGNELLFQATRSMYGLLLLAYIALVLYLQLDLFCCRIRQVRKRGGCSALRELLHLCVAYLGPAQEFTGRELLAKRGYACFLRGGFYQA